MAIWLCKMTNHYHLLSCMWKEIHQIVMTDIIIYIDIHLSMFFATQEILITRKQITRVPRLWNWSQILQPYVSFSSSQIHSFATVIIDRLLIVHDLCIFFMLLLSSIQHQTETLREMNKITPYGVCSLSNYKTTFEMMMRNCHEVCE